MMSFKNIHFLFSFILIFYIVDAFNITTILNQYPNYVDFNSYISQTGLAEDINSRRTITILAASDVSAISRKSPAVIKSILSVHVILDYYDLKKLQRISNKTLILTTLFQTTGKARGQQGFINVTDFGSGNVRIGSAVDGAINGASLIGTVASQPYNISVLQISSLIVPPGLGNITLPPTKALAPAPATTPTPKKSRTPAPAPSSNSPSPPASSPKSKSDAPIADTPSADAPAAAKSTSSSFGLSLSLEAVLTIVSSAMWLAMH